MDTYPKKRYPNWKHCWKINYPNRHTEKWRDIPETDPDKIACLRIFKESDIAYREAKSDWVLNHPIEHIERLASIKRKREERQ